MSYLLLKKVQLKYTLLAMAACMVMQFCNAQTPTDTAVLGFMQLHRFKNATVEKATRAVFKKYHTAVYVYAGNDQSNFSISVANSSAL